MKRTLIEYADYSAGYANFVIRGKTPGECEVGPGCVNCYVKRCWVRNPEAWPDVTTFYPDKLEKLSRCRPSPNGTPYRRGGSRPIVFVCDAGDLFHDRVQRDEIELALDTMASRPDIDFLVLTKRPARMAGAVNRWLASFERAHAPDHIWFGTTVPSDESAGERLDWLMRVRSFSRWVSVEPMLGYVDFSTHLGIWTSDLMWVAVGGESGDKARDLDVQAAIQMVQELQDRKVPVFVKQMGTRWVDEWRKGQDRRHDPHGRDMLLWPMELRVRQFPDR